MIHDYTNDLAQMINNAIIVNLHWNHGWTNFDYLNEGNRFTKWENQSFCFYSGREDLISTTFLSRRNKNRDLSMGSRAILPNNSTKQKRHMNRDISMKEIKDAEVRGINNKMFSEVAEKRRDSADVEDGSFMVQIPKSISKTNIVDQDYMNEVRA